MKRQTIERLIKIFSDPTEQVSDEENFEILDELQTELTRAKLKAGLRGIKE